MARMTGWLLLLALTALLLTGCTEQNVTIYRYDGTVVVGKLVSGDFESEELIVNVPDQGEVLIRFNDIKRIEMPQASRR